MACAIVRTRGCMHGLGRRGARPSGVGARGDAGSGGARERGRAGWERGGAVWRAGQAELGVRGEEELGTAVLGACGSEQRRERKRKKRGKRKKEK